MLLSCRSAICLLIPLERCRRRLREAADCDGVPAGCLGPRWPVRPSVAGPGLARGARGPRHRLWLRLPEPGWGVAPYSLYCLDPVTGGWGPDGGLYCQLGRHPVVQLPRAWSAAASDRELPQEHKPVLVWGPGPPIAPHVGLDPGVAVGALRPWWDAPRDSWGNDNRKKLTIRRCEEPLQKANYRLCRATGNTETQNRILNTH
ncbi:hypothetical protein NDU88_008790 [Pleurodeles waltl]|uniref:Uncharacterized protein n=1 Tax=Pleurodeles waltl TaxID=8319 RepID=A0AAV7QPM6_PLEWA|nr:hypothetical protein NDU88_008790 [Pleurodeles waltl]